MTSVSNQLFRGSGFLGLDPGVHQLALPELPDQAQRECIAICYFTTQRACIAICTAISSISPTGTPDQPLHCLTEYTKASISEEIRHRPHLQFHTWRVCYTCVLHRKSHPKAIFCEAQTPRIQ